ELSITFGTFGTLTPYPPAQGSALAVPELRAEPMTSADAPRRGCAQRAVAGRAVKLRAVRGGHRADVVRAGSGEVGEVVLGVLPGVEDDGHLRGLLPLRCGRHWRAAGVTGRSSW